jgi:hypothetical protein
MRLFTVRKSFHSPTTKAERPPLGIWLRELIQHTEKYLHAWRILPILKLRALNKLCSKLDMAGEIKSRVVEREGLAVRIED